MEHGNIVEQGFVEDLKEKYVLVRGEVKDAETAKKYLYSLSGSKYGFEGICPAEQLDKLAGMDIQAERPNLSQICVAIMKANSQLR
jgi:ABC-2 type transport system ATP-binding protein